MSVSLENGLPNTTTPSLAVTHAATQMRYKVLGFTLILTAIAYVDRVCISTLIPSIKTELSLTDSQTGYIFSAFIFAYALFEVPSGWLTDRFGPRLMLTRIVFWWSIMTAATGLAAGFASLFLIRALFGIGEAGLCPSIARVYARWLSKDERGRTFGLAIMIALIGGAITQPVATKLLGIMSWRYVFMIFGFLGILCAVGWYLWFRDDPHHHPAVNEGELHLIGNEPPIPHPTVPWKDLFRSRNLRIVCYMYFGVIYGWYFYLTWLPSYFQRACGFSREETGYLSALPLLSMALSVLIGGCFGDRLVRRFGARTGWRIPGIVSLPLAAISLLVAVMAKTPAVTVLFITIAAGFSALGVASAWAVCLAIGEKHAAVVSGAMNTFGNLGGAFSPFLAGWCVDYLHSWNLPLISAAGFYLIAAVCWLVIDPTERIPNT